MAIKNAADTELPIPITDGGTGQITQQAALDAITDVASATTGQVLTKDGSGNAVFQSPLEGGEQLLYFTATTTDATETTLGSVAVPADKAITFTIIVSAKGPSNKHYWAKIDGGARRNTAENAALVGVPANTNDDENTPGYSATVDVNGNDLRIRVTGASAESVVWDAKILYSSDAAGEDLISSKSILVFDTITTNATESTLATIAVPDLTNVSYWALVTAHLDNTGVDKNYWAVIEGGVRRNNGGNATLVGTRQIIEDDEGTPGYIADVDVSGTSLRIRVTGASSETVNWKCKVILVSDNASEQLIDFLPVRANDTFLQWRNQGDTADINVLKVDANNDTVLNALTGKSIEFKINEAIEWQIHSSGRLLSEPDGFIGINIDGSAANGRLRLMAHDGSAISLADSALIRIDSVNQGGNLAFSPGVGGDIQFNNQSDVTVWSIDGSTGDIVGTGSSNQSILRMDTSDSSDTKRIILAGGGSASNARGAAIYCHGNEYSGDEGNIYIISGAIGGTGTGEIIVRTAAASAINFEPNGSLAWQISSTGLLRSSVAHSVIGMDTTDGSDNKILQLNGGGAVSGSPWNRGAYVRLYGNEASSPGQLEIASGVVGANIDIRTFSTGEIVLATNNNGRWRVLTGGSYLPESNNAYDVGSSSLRVRTFYAVNALNTSDQRLKTNMSSIDITSALTKINALNPIQFQYEVNYDDGEARIRSGFKAQEVQTHIPEAVIAGDSDTNKVWGDEGFEPWSMQTDHIIPYLVAAIQKLSERIDALENP